MERTEQAGSSLAERECRQGHVGDYVTRKRAGRPNATIYCLRCNREAQRASGRARRGTGEPRGPRGAASGLWEGHNAEWVWLRQNGLSVAEIAAQIGMSAASLQRSLYRHVGGRELW